MSEFIKKVSKIQATLKAPKSQFNKFGNYAYRNAEDILEAVKPLLAESGLVLTVNDEIVFGLNGGENYIKAVATITDGTNSISNSALAREATEQKGMNPAQITGSTSSYARKYALNGLFLIDDTRDADATNTHGKEETKAVVQSKPAVSVKVATTEQAPVTKAKGFTAFKKQETTKGDLY
jgi:hypothetical protein